MLFTLKMALLANGFPQGWFQAAWIDDRVIHAFDLRRLLAALDMQFPGPMTALAPNRIASEDRGTIAVDRMLDRYRLIAVTEEAKYLNRPAKMLVPCEPG